MMMIKNVFQSWILQKPLLFKPVRAEQLHCVDYSIGGPQQTTSKSVHILTKVFMFFQMNLWLYLNDIYSIEAGHFVNMAESVKLSHTIILPHYHPALIRWTNLTGTGTEILEHIPCLNWWMLFFLFFPPSESTSCQCLHDTEPNSETDILTFEANLHAQSAVGKTQRDSGVICWELLQISDQNPTQMWRDLCKRITERTQRYTLNKLTLCALVCTDASFEWWFSQVHDKQVLRHCSLLNTQRTGLLSDFHCEAMSVSKKNLLISPCKGNLCVPPFVRAEISSWDVVLLLRRQSTRAKILSGVALLMEPKYSKGKRMTDFCIHPLNR